MKDLNVRLETVKLPEENTEKKILDTGLGNSVFGYDTKSTGNKSKNRHAWLHHTEKLHSQGSSQQSEKATYEVGESICKARRW